MCKETCKETCNLLQLPFFLPKKKALVACVCRWAIKLAKKHKMHPFEIDARQTYIQKIRKKLRQLLF